MGTNGERPGRLFHVTDYPAPDRHVVATGVICGHLGMLVSRTAKPAERLADTAGVLLLTAGTGWVRTSHAGRLRVAEPSLYWFAPGTTHAYGPDTEWTEQWVTMHGPTVDALLASGAIDVRQPVVPVRAAVEVTDLFSQLRYDLWGRQAHSHLLAVGIVLRLVGLTAYLREAATFVEESDLAATVAEVADQWRNDPADAELPPQLAALPPAAVRQAFRGVTGLSPKQFLLRARVERAKELLLSTDDDIHVVADRVGFTTASYFSRVFVAREGAPPAAWRAEHRR